MKLYAPNLYVYCVFYLPPPQESLALESLRQFFETCCEHETSEHHKDMQDATAVLNDPKIEILHFASGGNEEQGIASLCVFRRHDVAIAEFQWNQGSHDDVSADLFWQGIRNRLNLPELITALPAQQEFPAFFLGSTIVYLAQTDSRSETEKADFAANLGVTLDSRHIGVELPEYGRLYFLTQDQDGKQYLMLTEQEQGMYNRATEFLDREFAVLNSFHEKIYLEERETERIRAKSQEYAETFKQHFTSSEDENFQQIACFKTWLIEFQDHLDALAGLRLTLQINLRNAQELWNALHPEHDTLFPDLYEERASHLIEQIGYDLGYLQITMNAADRHLTFQELQIQQARLQQEQRLEQQQAAQEARQARQERRIERLIAAIGVAIGVGQVAAIEFAS